MTESLPPLPPSANVPLAYGYADGRRGGNGPAVASLVLGIIGCVPFITGALAIILGIVGIRKARNPSIGGKGMAVAGLTLGIVSVAGWGLCSGILGKAYVDSKPAKIVADRFLRDLTQGDINDALANSTGISAADLHRQSAQLTQFGALQAISISSFNLSMVNGRTTVQLGGAATFAGGKRSCTFELLKSGGVYRVTSYSVQ